MVTGDYTGEYLEKGIWRNFDFALLGIALLLCLIGVISIYSANMNTGSTFQQGLYIRQMYWIALSVAAMFIVILIDYHFLERIAYPLYIVSVFSLIVVDMVGKVASGSQRWLSLGGYNLQPSEFIKIVIIILLARMMDDLEKEEKLGFRELLKPAFFVAIPFLMVARQPDLGTASFYLLVFASIVLFTGLAKRTFFIISGGLAVLAPIFWFMLKPYQKSRILTTLNPEADPMGHGYQTIQSKIAVGSGGFWGKGIFEGTQSKLNFLPAKHTDFIFSVVAEEVGFLGSFVLIVIFFFLIMRLLEISLRARDKFGSVAVFGICAMISFNILYNIGMALGLFPIVGIPLPFISYGGSSLITNFIGIGLAINISLRKFRVE
ncbi:Rod shape-determining protein RodA [hydrothermal vent metagenome]|uniref:Rod shape-determining protein RodA n=1 Tax=hydrothermal vent metagenome TaxID=652676 RepID=A0A3B1BKA9_9ZZZZ